MQNLDYNVPGGKLNRGISVVDSVEILKGRKLSEDEYFKAALLGWCIELVRSFCVPFCAVLPPLPHSVLSSLCCPCARYSMLTAVRRPGILSCKRSSSCRTT